MNRPKIMHFIHELNVGGAETLVKNYMLNFDSKKFDVVLFCFNHCEKSPYDALLERAGVRVVYADTYIPFRKRRNVFVRFIRRCYRYVIFRRVVKKESPDILHTHLGLNRFVKFAKPKSETRIFHTVHSEPTALLAGNKKELNATKWLIGRYEMRLIVLHDRMKCEVDDMFGANNSIVLNNGIDIEKIKSARGCGDVRSGLDVSNSAFVVGHVGRFSGVKNHDFLVEVFEKIKKTNKDAFLLMVGDGEDKERIEKKLGGKGLGGQYLILSNREDVSDLLSAMDVFVFPSKYEGLGMALVEAQGAKLPCFVSDAVPEHATISNLVTRMSLADGADKWAETILLYKKPKKVIVNDDDWDIKKITKQLEQIYLDALAERDNGKK